MTTERLYKGDVYQSCNDAKVVAVEPVDGYDKIACDRSVFFPMGGGQPSDVGTVSRGGEIWNVVAASDESLDSEVWHLTDAPSGTFAVGDEVELTIDWDLRFANMQRHCGEHMLSGTFHNLFGGVNKGFHMSDDYIAIDIDMDGRMLTDEELDLVQRTVNDAVLADLPVTVEYFENYEASRVRPVRKDVPHDGEVSVVTIGDASDPYDCIACCGTHPNSSAEVGLIAIYKHEPNKGMNRVYFDCGIRALEYLSAHDRLLTDVANRNSCSPEDLLHKLERDEESLETLKAQATRLASYVRDAEKEKILSLIRNRRSTSEIEKDKSNTEQNRNIIKNFEENKSGIIPKKESGNKIENQNIKSISELVCVYEFDILSVDDLLKLGFAVISEAAGELLVLLHPESKTALLFSSGTAKCGALVREHASAFAGRGGGRDDNARAVFETEKDMRAFAEFLLANQE